MKTLPLFFSIARAGTSSFVNAAHVVRIDIDAATRESGSLTLVDGSTVDLNANDVDWIFRLMAIGADEQMQALSEFKKRTG